MTSVSIFEAKTNLSKYVSSIVERTEPAIIIVRNGKPVAKLVPYETETSNRIGIAEGLIPSLDDLEDFNSIDMESIFMGNGGAF